MKRKERFNFVVYDVYRDKTDFQKKQNVHRHFIVWLDERIDFSTVKTISKELEQPSQLVLAKGSDQVIINVSFTEPMLNSNILGAQSSREVGGVHEEADQE